VEKTPKRKIGDIGEDVAVKYFERRGYRLIDRNYLRPWGEIDLILKRGSKLHFVEIKTVRREAGQVSREPYRSSRGVRPEENMHRKKVKRLSRAIQTYLLEHRIPEKTDWQIDLACIYLDFSTRRATVEMFENLTF
jgi:putative endonuclease